ncbi:MAG: hypothetical protein OES32_08400 [Acidobacteriota bacterium]|nr:hypothetical protein [Acidobacteriota bacterium]MDH3523594.1 hypothetical protein [Acidobacteriota bacterium]
MKKATRVVPFFVLGLLVAGPRPALAQPTFSIEFQGPTWGAPDGAGGIPILEGDVLIPFPPGTPPPAPAIVMPAAPPGLGLVVPPLVPFVEVDALSYGLDPPPTSLQMIDYALSVDEYAVGRPGQPPPSVFSEGAFGFAEASADVYVVRTRPGPVPPSALGRNSGIFDGNGLPPFGAPGINLLEPNPPTPLGLPDPGDTLDALDMDSPPMHPVFFSLDYHIPDLLEIPPANTGSAGFQGFVGGDVLLTPAPGAPPVPYAPAALLGLDFNGGTPDVDDVDALVVWDDGDLLYNPTVGPYSWEAGTDMVLYSVRRDSSIIGLVDVLVGAPIEEGDVLVPVFDVVDGIPMFDGVEGDFDPGIFASAESLGLATVRSGTAVGWGVINPAYGLDVWGDDLDALDELPGPVWMIFSDGFESGDTSAWSNTVP